MLAPRTGQAVELMTRFAERTGLTGDLPSRRYLWTDAFAVCNFLGLSRATGEGRYAELALRLVDQVHRILGHHRPDDARTGWLGGPDGAANDAHPTRAGLRIGKRLPERGPREPIDERLEWDRDGQYFHYLTKWMHALDQLARATGQGMFNLWARELADTAHRAFVCTRPGAGKGMYWKASIDLSRPQVTSMGQHDPLDGLLTCVQLEATAARLGVSGSGPRLAAAVEDFAAMLDRGRLATDDPLGIGGLLIDACRVELLVRQDAWPGAGDLLEALLAAGLLGLQRYVARHELRSPPEGRLAFRELGLAIGLAGLGLMERDARGSGSVAGLLGQLAAYAPVGAEIESCWSVPVHRRLRSWIDHEDINDVMLATCLLPEGLLQISLPR